MNDEPAARGTSTAVPASALKSATDPDAAPDLATEAPGPSPHDKPRDAHDIDLDRYGAFLFDLDGVLTPTAEVHERAWSQLFAEYFTGKPVMPYSDEDYFAWIDGKPRYDGVAAILASREIELPWGSPDDAPDQETVCGLGNRKNLVFNRVLEDEGVVAYPGSVALLDEMVRLGIKVAVVSSSKNAPAVLAAAGLADRFSVVIDGAVAAELGLAGKPHPDTYEYAAKLLGVPIDLAVVVEDALSGVASGHAGGFGLVLGVDRGAGEAALLAAGADVVVSDLGELVADHIPVEDSPSLLGELGNEWNHMDRNRFPADPWALREEVYSSEDLGLTETLFAVGNGYLGMRGNLDEGRFSYAHGTFINGFHETWPIRHAEDAFGFARVGQTIVNVPDAKLIRLYVDDEPLLLDEADLEQYSRELRFDDGTLVRDLIWRTPAGKRIHVKSTRMVSFVERHLSVLTYEVTPLDADAPIVVSSQILNRQDGQDEFTARRKTGLDPRKAESFTERVLQPQTQWCDDSRAVLTYRTTNSGMTLAVATDHVMETENFFETRSQVEPDRAKQVYRVAAKAGQTIRLTKTVAYHTSRVVPPEELVDRCRRTLDRALAEGTEKELSRQRAWLDDFWSRSDVVVGGNDAIQQAVRWTLLNLAQSAARAENNGISAKGVSGSGYGGHYFWDTEIYVLPFLTYTNPQWARNALRFRYTMLDAARDRARELTQRGALFPWRTINGEEASAYYAAGTAQYHIDADIAYAINQYVCASGDVEFLAREAVDIYVETARMWADLGFWRADGDDHFHIHGVTGPDEYTTVVNDNLFTNAMARFNLRLAVQTVNWLRDERPTDYAHMVGRLGLQDVEVAEWARAADMMAIPFEEHLGIHPQDSHFLEREIWDLANTPASMRPLLLHYHPLVIYRFQVLKQADVVLALVLHGNEFTRAQKLADFEYYDPITTGDSTLSAVAQSIIAAEVGYQDLALEYFVSSLFVDLADLHHNTADGLHVASAGGVWNALVQGFGGMRDHGGRLEFDPRLPVGWDSLSFKMTVGQTRVRATIEASRIGFEIEEGESLTVSVRGSEVVVALGAPVDIILADQGPILDGAPSMRALRGNRRADGTLITSAVPHLADE